ncbi:MAG: SCP2 sterol-binding domain-containing protein [Thermus sp.]|uniref:SCP2 sterol-binding domain-containing protein n=1 Tax=Thermus sp. TaxID=275 RepID=UPI0025E38190|nr:SCP2 sterol-binding domain-containing protein [Thermus sp.]MCS6868262.1 SCP2 sterol-binding domain-containing protein [Thermus sp.]MCS7218673.1 SCP2 sterol-binding domain-containing protein [Thermus sp.]MCX7848581.1 SCP2 sterol-binding domain-containing protein [Thermus sp.]MDW8017864.1 SCP2 sterol-binding domain-containing protein [Thermus sp.]MDW8358169.1 SCP2 sterol-binding domain-containing protein [Thermus sp.]
MQLFSEAWAQAYCQKLSESEAYRKAAATWEGSLALAVRQDPAQGLPQGVAVVLDLWHGTCRGVKVVEGEAEADFVIEADLATWQEVLSGGLEPLTALMRGLLELKKGSIAALAPYAQAAQELVRVAREVA